VLRRRSAAERAVDAAATMGVAATRALAIVLLAAPIVLVVFLSFGAEQYTVIPPAAYSLQWYRNIFAQREFVPAFVTSVKIAAVVTVLSVVTGTLAACALRRHAVRGRRVLEAALLSPITVPLVVTGSALLVLFGRGGFGSSFGNIVAGHVIVTFPYVMGTVTVALARYDRGLDEAAAGLGARPWQVFRRVTLPLIRPGVFAGALFAFIESFDNFTVTIFLMGADTQTLPVAIYQYMEWNLDPTVSAISALLIVLAVALTLTIERTMGLDRFIGIRG
jgi:putative spermidine/putrescine transport system permease protein